MASRVRRHKIPQLDKLPDAPNVVYMPAMKFGSTGQEAMTWAMNTYLAGMCCQRYAKSKIEQS